MTTFTKTALVNYSAKNMLMLVDDVEKYPEFLKWCVSSAVKKVSEYKKLGELGVQIAGMNMQFKTQNVINLVQKSKKNSHYTLEMNLIEGPFTRLQGQWIFLPLDIDSSKVSLTMNYQLKSGIFNRILSLQFDRIAQRLFSDFINRAEVIYG